MTLLLLFRPRSAGVAVAVHYLAPPERRLFVPAELRRLAVPVEDRTLEVPAEDRRKGIA